MVECPTMPHYVISSLSRRQVSAGGEAASQELRARVIAAPTVSCYEHGHLLAIGLICGFRAHGNDTVRWAHTLAETVMTQCLQITHLLSSSPLPQSYFPNPLALFSPRAWWTSSAGYVADSELSRASELKLLSSLQLP